MRRLLLLALFLGFFLSPVVARADAFDHYTNDILVKIPKAKDVVRVKELTEEMLVDNVNVLPDLKPAFIVVKTNEGRLCKLLVQSAKQKLPGKGEVPILYIDRYVTYRESEDSTVVAEGKNVRLFADFQFSLDLGQVVPAVVGGDIVFIVKDGDIHVAPLGNAEIYLVKKHLPEAKPKKADKIIIGAKFEAKYFNGDYQLYDDGRRSGKLHLEVNEEGDFVNSWYLSDKPGSKKYDVSGKIGERNHTIRFTVQLPNVTQEFQGWMFTGNGQAITGFSRLLERETGFYAVRIEAK
jgi:hypothetical protein